MRQVQQIMGMPIVVELCTTAAIAEPVFEQIFDYLRHIDTVFSTYKPDSEISRINSGQLLTTNASSEVRQILADCARYKVETSGYFDIEHDGQINPSGLVKGHAIRRAALLIEQAGIHNYFVAAGGDIQTGGVNDTGDPWRTGIQHPIERDKLSRVVELRDAAIATSGTYERGSHIYNPLDDDTAGELLSLSVIGPRIDVVDVYATAAFAMGRAGLDWLAQRQLAAYAITVDLQTLSTPEFAQYAV